MRLVFSLLGVLAVLIIGGALVYDYDRLPAGWPNWRLFGPVVLHLPGGPSIGAQLAALRGAEAAARAHAAKVETAQAEISVVAGAHDDAAQAGLRTLTRILIKKVPVYVTPQTDARYPLPWGFVRVHDAAARGIDVSAVSLPAGQSDDGPASIPPSAAAAVIAANYGDCHADGQQLGDLIDWVSAERAAAK